MTPTPKPASTPQTFSQWWAERTAIAGQFGGGLDELLHDLARAAWEASARSQAERVAELEEAALRLCNAAMVTADRFVCPDAFAPAVRMAALAIGLQARQPPPAPRATSCDMACKRCGAKDGELPERCPGVSPAPRAEVAEGPREPDGVSIESLRTWLASWPAAADVIPIVRSTLWWLIELADLAPTAEEARESQPALRCCCGSSNHQCPNPGVVLVRATPIIPPRDPTGFPMLDSSRKETIQMYCREHADERLSGTYSPAWRFEDVDAPSSQPAPVSLHVLGCIQAIFDLASARLRNPPLDPMVEHDLNEIVRNCLSATNDLHPQPAPAATEKAASGLMYENEFQPPPAAGSSPQAVAAWCPRCGHCVAAHENGGCWECGFACSTLPLRAAPSAPVAAGTPKWRCGREGCLHHTIDQATAHGSGSATAITPSKGVAAGTPEGPEPLTAAELAAVRAMIRWLAVHDKAAAIAAARAALPGGTK